MVIESKCVVVLEVELERTIGVCSRKKYTSGPYSAERKNGNIALK
jgi:hypothetical protein